MPGDYLQILSTPSVRAAQAAHGSLALSSRVGSRPTEAVLTEVEREFIALRDSFYLATVSESGWPYVQHRGGPPGFLRVLDDRTLAFADLRGNRQYLSVGNLAANDRAALFLMDYANRRRLKILARAEVRELGDPAIAEAASALAAGRGHPEGVMLLHVEAFAWNCPQHITPRFTEAELGGLVATLRERVAVLERENQALIAQLAPQPRD